MNACSPTERPVASVAQAREKLSLRDSESIKALKSKLAVPQSTAAPSNAATKFVADMQPGYNIGNTLDAIPSETSWGNPPITQALLQKIKSLGYKSLRLPVTWGGHESAGPDYTVDPV